MSDNYTQKATYEWEWRDTSGKYQGVRYFPETDRLIWSGWRMTSEGPRFDDGYAQSAANFLTQGVTHTTPPAALVTELEQTIRAAKQMSITSSSGGRWFEFWKWWS